MSLFKPYAKLVSICILDFYELGLIGFDIYTTATISLDLEMVYYFSILDKEAQGTLEFVPLGAFVSEGLLCSNQP